MMLRLLLFLLCALPLPASTVMLTVTGRVSETDAASFFPDPPVAVGDQWMATMTWHYPTSGSEFFGEWNYNDPLGSLGFTVNGHAWESTQLAGFLGNTSFDAHLFSTVAAPAGLTTPSRNSSIGLTWYGLIPAVTNKTTLPQSFADWNLPSANPFDLVVRTAIGQPGSAWLIRANAWDTLTIQVIPEPATAGLEGAAAVVLLTRRCRVAS